MLMSPKRSQGFKKILFVYALFEVKKFLTIYSICQISIVGEDNFLKL